MDALGTLSPYRTEHINRFGNYVIDFDRMPEPLEQHMGLSFIASLGVTQQPVCRCITEQYR
jgi:hypothetical protein